MKARPTERPYTTPLFILRCVQIGLHMTDLDTLDMGMVMDIMTEAGNDTYKGYKELATQEDMEIFAHGG